MGSTARGIHPTWRSDSVVINLKFRIFLMLFRALVLVDNMYYDLVLYSQYLYVY